MSLFCVYVLYSAKLDRYYVGYSSDMEKRMKDHLAGISKYTSKALDWELKHKEYFGSREEAMSREKYIKSLKSRRYLESLISGKV